jgi:tRNA (guanine-N7-)-methyltransferase
LRLRNKPWANEKIAQHSDIIIADPVKMVGNWEGVFGNSNPIYIEVGTGKGKFLTELAKRNPDVNYIGVEKFQSVIIHALEKVLKEELPNLKLLNIDAVLLQEIFTKGELSQVYLNFSDPWPKKRHEKRRLTYQSFLDMYQFVLKENGEVHLKTDNQGLFEYSIESFSKYGMVVKNVSLDLHKSDREDNVMTEYEEKFSESGSRIYRCEAEYLNSL